MVMSPLSVIARMNLGQILKSLGAAGYKLDKNMFRFLKSLMSIIAELTRLVLVPR